MLGALELQQTNVTVRPKTGNKRGQIQHPPIIEDTYKAINKLKNNKAPDRRMPLAHGAIAHIPIANLTKFLIAYILVTYIPIAHKVNIVLSQQHIIN